MLFTAQRFFNYVYVVFDDFNDFIVFVESTYIRQSVHFLVRL